MSDEQLPPYVATYAQSTPVPPRVGFGRRVSAKLLDGIISFAISVGVYYALGPGIQAALGDMVREQLYQQGQDVEALGYQMMDLMLAVSKLATINYAVTILLSLFELFLGAGPGKMLLSIEIAHADGRKGDLALWGRRWLMMNISTMLALVTFFTAIPVFSTIGGIIGFVIILGAFAMLSERRQALHDIVAGSAVFRDTDVIKHTR